MRAAAGRRPRALRTAAVVVLLALLTACSPEADDVSLEPTTPPVADPSVAAEPPAPVEASAQEWATQVCGAATTWRDEVDDVVAALPRSATGLDAGTDVQTLVERPLRRVADASRTAADEIAAAELPPTRNREALQGEIDTIRGALSDSGAAVEDALAPDQSLLQLVASATTAVEVVQRNLAELDAAFGRVSDLELGDELQRALQQDPACQALLSA